MYHLIQSLEYPHIPPKYTQVYTRYDSQPTGTILLYGINRLVFVTKPGCVYREVGIEMS